MFFFWLSILAMGLPTSAMAQEAEESPAILYSRFQAPGVLEIHYTVDPIQTLKDTQGNGGNVPYGLSHVELFLVSPNGDEVLLAEGLNPYVGNYMVPEPQVGVYNAYMRFTCHEGSEHEYEETWNGFTVIEDWGRITFNGDVVAGSPSTSLDISAGPSPVLYIQVNVEEGIALTLRHFSVEAGGSMGYAGEFSGTGSISLNDCDFSELVYLTVHDVRDIEFKNCSFGNGLGVYNAGEVAVFDSDFHTGGSLSLSAKDLHFEGNFVRDAGCSLFGEINCNIFGNDFYTDYCSVRYDPGGTYIVGNVFAMHLLVNAPGIADGDTLEIRNNNFLRSVDVIRSSSGTPVVDLKLPENYWGSWRGHQGQFSFLDEELGYREMGVERVTSSSMPVPDSPVAATVDYGQNILGQGYPNVYLRRNRTLLVRAFIDIHWGSASASEFTLVTSNGSYSPRNNGLNMVRDFGRPGTGANSRSEYLEFYVTPPASGDLTATLVRTHDGVETEMDDITVGFHPGPARKLRIGVIPVRVVGYKTNFIYPSPSVVAATALKKAIVSMLPLAPDEVDVLAYPPAEYRFGYTALLSLLSTTAMMNEVSSAFNSHLDLINTKLDEPLDLLVVCLPNTTMGVGNLGASLSLRRRVILLDEVAPDAALHEIGHYLGLYNVKEQYTVFDEGYGDDGYYYKDGKGIRLEGLTAFVPDSGWSHETVSGQIRNFPMGLDCGVYDIMGGDAPQFIIPSTHADMSRGLFDLLGTAAETQATVEESADTSPIKATSVETETLTVLGQPAEGTRRVVARGFFARDYDEHLWRLVRPRVSFGEAPSDIDVIRQGVYTGYRFRAYNDQGNQVYSDEVFASGMGPLSDWIQTFDVPDTAVRYELHHLSEENPVYLIHETYPALDIQLTGSIAGAAEAVDLAWNAAHDAPTGRRASTFLQASTDGGATWSTVGFQEEDGAVSMDAASMDRPADVRFRAGASDGFTTVFSDIVGPFDMGGTEPEPSLTIEQPKAGAVGTEEELWQLTATVSPAGKKVSSVSWASDIDGVLGNHLSVLTEEGISAGNHTVRCEIEMEDGACLSNTVLIHVYTEDPAADLAISAEDLELRVDGIEPTYGPVNWPQYGKATTLLLAVHNPGVAGEAEVRLNVEPPSGVETNLTVQNFHWSPRETKWVEVTWTPDEIGDWTIRGEISWSGVDAPTDPDSSNNSFIRTFTNTAPVARDLSARLESGQSVDIGLIGHDANGDPLTYSLVSAPGHGTYTWTGGSDLRYTPEPGFTGADSITYGVSDAIHDRVDGVISLAVLPAPPAITSPTNLTGRQYESLSYQITAEGEDIRYGSRWFYLPGQPWEGSTFDAATGTISGVPENHGEATMILSAENFVGRHEIFLAVEIAQNRDLPVPTSAATASATAGEPFSYDLTYDGRMTEMVVGELPVGLFAYPYQGLISGEPVNSGQYLIPIGLKNDFGTHWFNLELRVDLATRAPSVPAYTTFHGEVGTPFDQQIAAQFDAHRFAIAGLPVGLALDARTGRITGTPLESGSFWLSVEVSNLNGTCTGDVIFNIESLDGAPVLGGASIYGVGYDQAASYQIVASNSPTGYRAEGLPAGLSVNPVTGLISGRSTEPGDYEVILYADNNAGTGGRRLLLSVYIDFDKPYLSAGSSLYTTTGAMLDTALELANNPTRVEVSNLPPGISFDPSSMRLTGRASRIGIYEATVEAENSYGIAVHLYRITVAPDYAAWKVAYGSGEDGGDADADGLANIFEYIFGRDPSANDAEPLCRLTHVDGQAWMSLRLPPGGTGHPLTGYELGGVTFYLETSENLNLAWARTLSGMGGGVTESADNDGWRVLDIPVMIPAAGHGRFFRFIAETP